MGREFVARKSSVWGKKSDTKPSLFTSRPFPVQTRQDNTVNKKELPSEIPPANYITDKIGFNSCQPAVQRQEDNSDKEQEPDLMSKSDESPVGDEEEKISPQLEDENKQESVNLKPAVEEGDEETISPQLEDENKKEDLQLAADEPKKEEDMVSPQLEDENKQEELNKKSIQTKLTVGEPGDKYEQEADTVAAKVVEHINSPKSQQPVQGKVEPVVQPSLMRQGGAGKGTVNRDVEQNIQQARGGGQGLADNVRQPMEQAFGADFSGVKVHTGGQADVLNRSLNSRAFATGQDIFFKQGEYNPGSRGGQELLAHELTHVVQQTNTIRKSEQKSSEKAVKNGDNKPARLHIHADIDTDDFGLDSLKAAEVGHAWISLEWKEPATIPKTIPSNHKKFLSRGGMFADPMGFWPRMFGAYDSSIEEWSSLPRPGQEPPGYTGPTRVSYSTNIFSSYVPGQMLHPDNMHKDTVKATQSYDLTESEVQSVINYAESKRGADYSVYFYNCTTFVKEAVQAAGKNPPSMSTAGICYPNALYESIKKNQKEKVGSEESSGKKNN